jgi:isoleucyl-tRNA synthetase
MLTNWYVRRSRQRFFDEDQDAFDALYTALESVCRVAAPLLPMVAEEIWRGLTGGRSVHLTDWPDAALFADDPALVAQMDRTQAVCSAGSSLRKAAKLRVRLPLSELTVVVPGAAALAGSEPVIADELNIKSVRLLDAAEASEEEFGIERKLVVNARAAGPRLGKGVQQAIKGSKSGDWSVDDAGAVTAGGLALEPGEYTLETVVDPAKAGEHAAVAMLPGGGFVVLDTGLTPELEAEGLARDLVRTVQQARKEAGLAVGDRIRASITAKAPVIAAAETHEELLKGETLAVELELLVADVEPTAVVGRVGAQQADAR